MTTAVKSRGIHLCDSVVRSSTGLPTINSIYPHRIVGPTKPWVKNLCIFLSFERAVNIEVSLEVRITSPNLKLAGKTNIDPGSKYFDLEMTFSLLVARQGDLHIDWRVDGGRWTKGPRWSVGFAGSATDLSDEEGKKLKDFYRSFVSAHEVMERIELGFSQIRY